MTSSPGEPFAADVFPSSASMGHCFRCDRDGIQVICFGELDGVYGPMPAFTCRDCTDRLITLYQRAHENVVRRYVRARSHPH